MVYGFFDTNNYTFLKSVRISSSTVINSRTKLKIKDGVWIWHHSVIDASNGITIGEGCQIGAFVGIFTHSSHISIRLHGSDYMNVPVDDRIGYIRGSVEIGDYTFIGTGSFIFPGSRIGKGCIILAGTHVKGEVPDYSVVSGNPSKIIANVAQIDRMYLKENKFLNQYFDPSLLEEMKRKHLKK